MQYVINNNMYAVIRKRQQDLFRQRTIGNDPSDGVPAPDFNRKLAKRPLEDLAPFMDRELLVQEMVIKLLEK